MIMLVIGIIFIIISLLVYLKANSFKKFKNALVSEDKKDFKKTVGTVICNAYHISDAAELNKPVTPIVAYEVNGNKYEAQKATLSNDAELPVGTKIYLWYKKSDPNVAILGIDLDKDFKNKFLATALLVFGILFIIIRIVVY